MSVWEVGKQIRYCGGEDQCWNELNCQCIFTCQWRKISTRKSCERSLHRIYLLTIEFLL